jgi:hypothetical protein
MGWDALESTGDKRVAFARNQLLYHNAITPRETTQVLYNCLPANTHTHTLTHTHLVVIELAQEEKNDGALE